MDDHQALRELRDEFVRVYNASDLDGLLALLDEHVAFTPMNGEVCHGHEGVRAFFNRLLNGPNPPVKSYKIEKLEADGLTVLYSDIFGVATGWADTSYHLSDGMNFSARLRWTYCFTKASGAWKIAAFHTSSNIFDNSVLSLTRTAMRYKAAAGAALSLMAGAALGWALRRR